ncbi:MAG: NADH-quinone oxidoreductase subunit J [Pseudomonadota bacterium]
MTPIITTILFYCFATILMGAALAVITAKNPVHSVFFLIVAFFNAAGLFVLLGAEYIAMTLVIVYVGAVAVLFLFVVMMLNINFEKLRAGFISYLPLGIAVAVILFAELAALLYSSILTPAPLAEAASPIPDLAQVSNAHAIGRVLYTDYIIAFQLSGIILLVAMIGAIVLTHRQRIGVKRQNIAKQMARTRAESVALINVKPGEGI